MKLKDAIQVSEWLNKDAGNQAKVQHSICGTEDRLKTIQNKVQGMLWGFISLLCSYTTRNCPLGAATVCRTPILGLTAFQR